MKLEIQVNRVERVIEILEPLVVHHERYIKALSKFWKDPNTIDEYMAMENNLITELTGLTKDELQTITVSNRKEIIMHITKDMMLSDDFQKTSPQPETSSDKEKEK